jgi:5'-3' exonuclease
MVGCTSDSVGGISGVGDKTACKFLNRQLSITSKAYRDIRANKVLIDQNLKLVTLPYPGTKVFPIQKDTLSLKGFITICQKYGFESFMWKDSIAQWKEHVFR